MRRCARSPGIRVAALAIALAACGPSAPPPAQPDWPKAQPQPYPVPAEPSAPALESEGDEVAALERDLAVAEQHLDAELGRKRAGDEQEVARGGAPAPPAPPPFAHQPGTPAPPPAPADEPKPRRSAEVGTPCDVACRAYRSMESSVERICTLTHEGHARCQTARGRLQGARQRIGEAGCACLRPGRPS